MTVSSSDCRRGRRPHNLVAHQEIHFFIEGDGSIAFCVRVYVRVRVMDN
jgi:hypothetical protein